MNLKDKLKRIKIKNQHWSKELTNFEIEEIYKLTNFLPKHYNITIRRIYIINDILTEYRCPICGNEILKIDSTNQILKIFCSPKCRQSIEGRKLTSIKQTNTCLEKYGADFFKKNGKKSIEDQELINKKRENTVLEKYGTKNVFQNLEIQHKSKSTTLEKYGTEHYTQTIQYKEDCKKTCMEKYNVENVSQLSNIKIKIKENRRLNHWENFKKALKNKHLDIVSKKEEYITSNAGDILKFKCLRCDDIFDFEIMENQGIEIKDISCSNHKFSSIQEEDITVWLKSQIPNIELRNNDRFYYDNNKYQELDIYLPEYNIGIEYHGLYWHSSKYRSKLYHQDKYIFFKNIGIFVIQIFEDEWSSDQQYIKNIILNNIYKTNHLNLDIFGKYITESENGIILDPRMINVKSENIQPPDKYINNKNLDVWDAGKIILNLTNDTK